MLHSNRAAGAAIAASFLLSLFQLPAWAQSPEILPILVITGDRIPIDRSISGTAIHVIPADELAAWGSRSVADVLRGSPGLDITEQGGVGGLSNASIRGAAQGQTLVLVNGIRVGDPAGIAGEFDFNALPLANIERIEVLRGPQSALYGSDAMGGVINIITKVGSGKSHSTLTLEAGSYGTVFSQLTTTGSTSKFSWAISLSGLQSEGFSRYGHRIGRIEQFLARPLERDSTNRIGGSARIGYTLAPGSTLEFGFHRQHSTFRFDNPGAFDPAERDSRLNRGRLTSTLLFTKLKFLTLDGKLENAITVFTGMTDRFNRLENSCYDAFFAAYNCDVTFNSRRYGVEYQGTLKTQRLGMFVFGVKSEREQATNHEVFLSAPFSKLTNFDSAQTTQSAFLLHRFNIGQLHLSLGGRVDSIDATNHFGTWRVTAAYNIAATNTVLRASAGTGARAPSLFQRFSKYGTPSLDVEKNIGFEIGADQWLLDRRLKLSATAFDTRYTNLIDFDFSLNGGIGGYFNVGRARMSGLEFSGDYIIVPGDWKVRASYTRLRAIDEDRSLPLLRRPRDKASAALIYSGFAGFEAQGRVTFVGARPDVINDFPYSRVQLKRYAKLDMRMSYAFSEQLSMFVKVENLTNRRYEEIRDYGTMGRAFFAGATMKW
jgi:vitamin B12 transporter